MTSMLKGEIIFQWKKHPEKVDIACLILDHTTENPKYKELHTFSFPIDKGVNEHSYTSYFRDFINGWADDLRIISSDSEMGYEITYREFGGEYSFRVYKTIDLKEMANSLWTPFIRDLCNRITTYNTDSVDITIDWEEVYSETEKEFVMEKFVVQITHNFLTTCKDIPIKGKPLSVPRARSVLASIAEENWPFDHKQEIRDSIRYIRKEVEPIGIIHMKGRVRNSSIFVKKLMQEYKQFGKNPKKFLDRYKPEIGITSLARMMRGE